MVTDVHMIELSDGAEMPAIGQGTWYLGEGRSPRDEEVEALRAGVEAGVMLVDTAEMYGDGNVIAIPRTSSAVHAVENAGAAELELDDRDLEILDRAFPAPTRKVPLDMQ